MEFPPVTVAKWRELVEKELAGKPFEQALVHEAMEGIRIAPLYTEGPPGGALPRELPAGRFRICVRPATAEVGALLAEVRDGADALWLALAAVPEALSSHQELAQTFFALDVGGVSAEAAYETVITRLSGSAGAPRFALYCDPLARRAKGLVTGAELPTELVALGQLGRLVSERSAGGSAAVVSTLGYHDAGADAVEELAIALATGVCYLGALRGAGLAVQQAAQQIALQVAVGRDTFIELCKLRALRVCWRKILCASGAAEAPPARVHAVCSSRTLTVRDPWVNMLRATTQVFSAVLGGADLVTPSAFDQLLCVPSALGQRVARNTGLVLREESRLGQVADPAGGSYYFDSLTDALARQAWQRFQRIEQQGGIAAVLESGELAAQLQAARAKQLDRIARRRTPILGVSEFADLSEQRPAGAERISVRTTPAGSEKLSPTVQPAQDPAGPRSSALFSVRDAAAFEALRARAESADPPPEVLLITLGSFAESRPRADFARGFFAAGGMRTRESTENAPARIACLCGSDERYASEAAARAQALKAAGCPRVLLAGRPGAQEAALRAAGIDGFIFLGCDAVATLTALLELVS